MTPFAASAMKAGAMTALVVGVAVHAILASAAQQTVGGVSSGRVIELLLGALLTIAVSGIVGLGKFVIGTHKEVAVIGAKMSTLSELKQKAEASAADVIELEGETSRLGADVGELKIRVDSVEEIATATAGVVGEVGKGGLAHELARLRDWRHDEAAGPLSVVNLEVPRLVEDVDALHKRVNDLERGTK